MLLNVLSRSCIMSNFTQIILYLYNLYFYFNDIIYVQRRFQNLKLKKNLTRPLNFGVGGACGYGTMVDVKPFRARVGAVSSALFKKGEGCGACYKVKCLDKTICSKRAVTVIITDESPALTKGLVHFDLSGSAFGRMAISGRNSNLRNRGKISIIYRK